MRAFTRLALAPVLALQAQAPSSTTDLDRWIQEALTRHPDLIRAEAQVRAAQAQVPQASALADPTVSLSVQNDGLSRWNIGQMENNFIGVMVTQPLSWPGKRDLRTRMAEQGVAAREAARDRIRLSLEADLRRAFAGLLLVRAQLKLHRDQEPLLQAAEAAARTRYEVGQASQSDLLRVQLERTRLRQSLLVLLAEARSFQSELNRLRAVPADTPVETSTTLLDLPLPDRPALEAALSDAVARCPELRAAQAMHAQAAQSIALAEKERRPDFAVSVGAMPRFGFDGSRLETMYQVGVSFTLPLWRKSKQDRQLAERTEGRIAQQASADSLRLTLQQRTQERVAQLEALLDADQLYRDGLLVQSEAGMHSALAQFQSGRATLLQALEGVNGWLADQSAFLQSRAQALAIGIALREASPGPTPSLSAHGLSTTALPSGAGSMTVVSSAPAAAAATPTASTPMSGM